ncbi:MFS transporter [Ectobacillus funiculus]|uniref:MFS transporter n=1 Tax=Ectobacillus funiculus TaxID=137993 RepID=A0ABV5WG51_9BACI
MKTHKIALGLVLMNLFIAFLGIGLVIPVLPTLMAELGITGTTVGYLTAAFAVAQLIVSPFAGKAVDKLGRKIMIVIGLFIFGISEFLFGFDLFRPAVTSYLSNIAGNEQGFVGGMNSMFTSLANISGPILGGILFDMDINYPYYFATVVLAPGIALTLFWKKPANNSSSEVKGMVL